MHGRVGCSNKRRQQQQDRGAPTHHAGLHAQSLVPHGATGGHTVVCGLLHKVNTAATTKVKIIRRAFVSELHLNEGGRVVCQRRNVKTSPSQQQKVLHACRNRVWLRREGCGGSLTS